MLADTLPTWVSGDPLRISQVLGNLLSNAVKFTGRGEVVLAATREGDVCVFQVRDSGIGLTEEQIGRLFSAFVQADTTTTRKFGGTGLGLAICKRLVELMGGDISVSSTPGAGSCFEVRLPLAEIDPPEGAGADSEDSDDLKANLGSRRLAGYRILAAEDNPVNQLVLDDMLTPEGATVTFADDGLQAIGLLQSHGESAFDIVLTDIQMPNLDGHQLAQRLRELHPGLPVVGLTAHAMAEERQRCFDNGMVAHVTKPIEMGPLISVVLKYARRPAAESAPPAATDATVPSSTGLAPAPGTPRLLGCRILAAEDNLTNQKVLEYMLLPEGAILTFVGDGRQALELLNTVGEWSFDLVLTDIQMPNMDGHQLAQRLRELYPSLPVAGLTAHNLVADRGRALAEGMVEHMIKPVEIESLVTVVQRHARQATQVGVADAGRNDVVPENAAPDPQTIDWVALTERFSGRQAFIDKLVATSLANTSDKAEALRAASAAQDFAAIAFIAHSLKSTGANMKASRVQMLGEQTEEAARASAPQACELAGQLALAIDALRAALARGAK
jgi:CheY-like chemotaxis protein/HPt (histidine-containing phosphotransfer) domain-containing protein